MINIQNEQPVLFTKRQKLLIIPFVVYVIALIVFLCYDADHTQNLTVRRIHALIGAAAFTLSTGKKIEDYIDFSALED